MRRSTIPTATGAIREAQALAGGLAGQVITRRNRKTGSVYTLYRAAEQGLDDIDGTMPWATVCETHATIMNHRTRALAEAHMAAADWCADCYEEALHV